MMFLLHLLEDKKNGENKDNIRLHNALVKEAMENELPSGARAENLIETPLECSDKRRHF
jgi:hypothetical protein